MIGEFEIPRMVVAYVQTTIDIASSIISLYVAAITTRNYGWHDPHERLLLIHRLLLVVVSMAFAWHAEDLATAPEKHGLTIENVLLHVALVSCIAISAIRVSRGIGVAKPRNGGLLGPIGRGH